MSDQARIQCGACGKSFAWGDLIWPPETDGPNLPPTCGPCTRGERPERERVDHPTHYGGADNPYEAIKVIEAWRLGFCLGNAVKYIARAGLKPGADRVEDLKKARWYLDRAIAAG